MLILTGDTLSNEELARIAYGIEKIKLAEHAIGAIKDSHKKVVELANAGNAIYGVNTGFGIFADKRITRDESIVLNRNLIYSHAVATGEPIPEPVVRAAMAIRINALAKGVSGIQYEIIEALTIMLNKKATPVVSSKGSLGSSGDLCLLAQIGLTLIEDESENENLTGQVQYENQVLSGKIALDKLGLSPIQFSYKDGLALINGATFSAAFTALAVYEAGELADIADIAASLSLEALRGVSNAFHPGIHALRNMAGQQKSAENIRSLTDGSTLIDSSDVLQDAYSLRCAPQVHGCVRDTIAHACQVVTSEINAATDNPLMVDDDTVISGGNFHGEPVGFVADFLAIALTELGAISERRTFRLVDKKLNNGLPAMLVGLGSSEGINSGVMILQYTAAALVLQNQTLATPDSIRSLPTSANQEDHNANAYNASLHLWEILENTTKVLAIEIYCAIRALQIRRISQPEFHLGKRTRIIFEQFSTEFSYESEDMQWRNDLEKLYQFLTFPNVFRRKLISVVNGIKS